MNLPFKLTISNTNPYGLLWNPWGTAVANSVNNAVLTGLSADLQAFYNLLMRTDGCYWLTGMNVMGDTVDAKVSLGIWNTLTSAGQFDELYPVVATVVAGGGAALRFHGSGIYLPVDAQHVPCFKYTPVTGTVTITGDLSLHPIVYANGNTSFGATVVVAPTKILLDEQSAAAITDEATPASNLIEE